MKKGDIQPEPQDEQPANFKQLIRGKKPKKFTEKQLAARFRPGQSGNPSGRPKGLVSLTKILRDKLNEISPKTQRTIAEDFIDALVEEAVDKRKIGQMAILFDRYEGKIAQPIQLANDPDAGPLEIGVIGDALRNMQKRWQGVQDRSNKGNNAKEVKQIKAPKTTPRNKEK